MAKAKKTHSNAEKGTTFGLSKGTVSERTANQSLSMLQNEQSRRSKATKQLISRYNVDQRHKDRLKQMEKDNSSFFRSKNNDYQKRSLTKRLRLSQQKANKTVRSKLHTYKTKRYESAVAAADSQVVLHTEDVGFLETEHDLEFTSRLKQVDLKQKFVDENTARHIYDLKLEAHGPYGCKYDRSGRYSVLFGQRGHLALMDSHQLSLHHEFHVQERVRDACFLHNFGMIAVAQTSHVYIYDDAGAEIHKLGEHVDPMALEFLPYHWLLASIGRSGYLKYQDTSTGDVVTTLRTKLGPCEVMRQNPSNSVLHLGHANGTVTMWSPSSSQYLAKLQCHKGAPITSMAVDLNGNTMVTGSADRQIKIWDLRKFQCTHAYFCDAGIPCSLDISQRNVLGIGHAGHATYWAPEALRKKIRQPYMHHAMPATTVETLRFRPFEDVCAIGHSQGLSSIVVPGSGESNLDTTEYNLNPFQDKKQRREAEVQALLEKLDPNMITLDPSQIGGMEESSPEIRRARLQDVQEEAEIHNCRKTKKQKTKKRGRSKIQVQMRRKQANVVDQQALKLREAREREKEEEYTSKPDESDAQSTTMEQRMVDNAPTALKRFFGSETSYSENVIMKKIPNESPSSRKKKGKVLNGTVGIGGFSLLLSIMTLSFFVYVRAEGDFFSNFSVKDGIPSRPKPLGGVALAVFPGLSVGSCASLTACENCTNTYTCHWCEHTESCHARGSPYGCTWGSICHKDPPKPKENSTCAGHTSCSECALASHFCHWCEHDNACHAIGSPYGCAVGVDCFSNDRCRRKDPEPLPKGDYIDVPSLSLIAILSVGLILVLCLTCCHYVTTNVKGAYDDLATITMAASVAPISIIGGNNGQFHSALVRRSEEGDDSIHIAAQDIGEEGVASNTEAEVSYSGHGDDEEAHQNSFDPPRDGSPLTNEDQEVSNSYYSLMNAPTNETTVGMRENRPLLHPSFNASVVGSSEGPRHMKRLCKCCTIIYFSCVVLVVVLVGLSILFYPKQPLYSVCNDAVAWKRIMTNIAELKFDASFEILLSLSNPNRIGAALDRGKGSYSFEGKQFGTFEIPPVSADAMAITDLMLIARVSPDRQQALQLLEAYYLGKLVLEAEFEGTIRLPTIFDLSFDIHVQHIVVDVNAMADRSLCHCGTWKNTSQPVLLERLMF